MNRSLHTTTNYMFAKRMNWLKKYPSVWVFFTVMLLSVTGVQAQQYWRVDNVGAALNTANWGPLGGPYTNAYVAGIPIVFTANSAITYSYAIAVNNISVTGGTTNWTGAGTYTTGGAVRTVDIAAGATLTWNAQPVSFVAGNGFIKNGAGTWNIGTQANNYPAGFTMNAGTVTLPRN
ncbi:MAG: hypothetical protein IPP72_22350 [Chitinophagaceae bacterium]|nr:hypothetical protein [Chitinophagaceae bacterium]